MPVEQVLDRHARHHGVEVPPKRRAVALEQYPADYARGRCADRSADHAAREADDGPHAGRHRRAGRGANLSRRDSCRSGAGDSPGDRGG